MNALRYPENFGYVVGFSSAMHILEEKGADVTYKEGPGAHEWDFWDRALKDALEWLPLGEKETEEPILESCGLNVQL